MPIPEGYHSVTPYLTVDDAAAAIEFYRKAFGAQELLRLPMSDGNGGEKLGHAEVKIGDSPLMLSDEWPGMGVLGPKARGGASASFLIYVPDVDHAFQCAIDAGASAEQQPTDQFWGDRMGTVTDPFGHKWMLATHVQDVPPDELPARMAAWARQQD
ncbi:MAG TPA: VOC family protein [Lysobacter sp.]|nr:VOC family protein [Lysobacter sp.]